MKHKVIFLDRDGVINKPAPPHDYIKSWEEFEFLPGAIEGLKILYDLGYKLVIVTNQRGIARGMLTWDKLNEIHEKMQEVLKQNGIIIDHIFVCPHDENDNCNCRKPKDGLLRKIEEYYEVDKENSYMIGDSESDIEAGKSYGIKTVCIGLRNIPLLSYYRFKTLEHFSKTVHDSKIFLDSGDQNRDLWLIFANQEYKSANDRELWLMISEILNKDTDLIIINISADLLVTVFKRKLYRLKEHFKGITKIGKNLFIFRPLFIIRPEIAPKIVNKIQGKLLFNQLKRFYPNLKGKRKIYFYYDPSILELLTSFDKNAIFLYYIIDEYGFYAHSDTLKPREYKLDIISCKRADFIFTMSESILEKRKKYNTAIKVIGNGCLLPNNSFIYNTNQIKFKNSVGLFGRFRNWIDFNLLYKLIKERQDLLFVFGGPIENNVHHIIGYLIDTFFNTIYLGNLKREMMPFAYKAVNVTIVPYKINHFIYSSRPIKIVESVFYGIPVVSVPINGYSHTYSFIKFAKNFKEFSSSIDWFLENPIDTASHEYREFLEKNSWNTIAKTIIETAKEIKNLKK